MDIFIFLIIIVQSLVFLFVFYFLYQKDKKGRQESHDLLTAYSNVLQITAKSFMEEIAQVEKKHFEQIEKQSSRQLAILEKQTKDFLKAITDLATVMQPKVPEITPHLLDNMEKMENSIEKEEIEEQNLDEIPRIPLVNGLNVQFEGEEEVFPIDIQ